MLKNAIYRIILLAVAHTVSDSFFYDKYLYYSPILFILILLDSQIIRRVSFGKLLANAYGIGIFAIILSQLIFILIIPLNVLVSGEDFGNEFLNSLAGEIPRRIAAAITLTISLILVVPFSALVAEIMFVKVYLKFKKN